MSKRMRFIIVCMVLLAGFVQPLSLHAQGGEPQRLILATTTSTDDSGLLDYILPDFELKFNASVDVVAVGTGQALELGTNGDADVVLVHARAREDAFVEAGDGTMRYDVMYNDFVIVGPASDPAGIMGMTDAAAAFAQIADQGAAFVSRGDDSGTHTKEKAIWSAAGITPEGDWYISAGQGMGAVLTMSDELAAYTLSDRATYVNMQSEGLGLAILVEGDSILFNPYGVIPVNPEKHPDINAQLGQAFADWLTSLPTQELIASYTVSDQQLFTPDSNAWRAAHAVEEGGEPQRLILATTTSTDDSGLLDYILPDFEQAYNASVDVVAVGTGQALELGTNGDADVVLVHARAREDAFVEAGDGTMRYDVMYNDFVIVGPASDPAGIMGMTDAAAAFAQIADQGASFVSRGDDSGTHTKEKAIWSAAGITPEGDWYISAGQGMGAVLTMSDELSAYTLSDRATYVNMQTEGLGLAIVVEGDPILFNPYGVIPVNPEQHPDINAQLGQAFADWLTSLPTQELIASYTIGDQQLFTPDSNAWRAAQAGQ